MSTAGPEPKPSVSAIVINFNGGERTIRTLHALSRQTRPPDRVVVVDNGSSDGSPGRILEMFPGTDVIRLGENVGLPAARNVGLEAVASDRVLLIDSDIYLEPDCLEILERTRAETDAAVICPRIRLIPERDVVQADGASAHFIGTMALRHANADVARAPTERARVAGCIGACYLLDRETVLAEGGFDDAYFFYFEDLEFMLRLGGRGHTFVCEPEALVYHERGTGTPGLSFRGKGRYPRRRAYLSMRNRWLTILLHYDARTILLLTPALLVYELVTVAWAVGHGWGREWFRSWFWLVRNGRETLDRRRKARSRKVRGDRSLLSGGPLPLASGVAERGPARAVATTLSWTLDAYWRAVRSLLDGR